MIIEQVSIECRNAKTKLITLTNHKGREESIVQSKLEARDLMHDDKWRGGQMVSVLYSGSNGPGPSLGQGTALCS